MESKLFRCGQCGNGFNLDVVPRGATATSVRCTCEEKMGSKGGEATLQTWIEYHGLTSLTLEHAARLEVLMLTTEKQAYANGFEAGYSAGRAEAQRWVPVSEEKPTKLSVSSSLVLCDEDGEYWFGYYGHDDRFHFYFGETIREDKVFTHWQPLPPPQEQK